MKREKCSKTSLGVERSPIVIDSMIAHFCIDTICIMNATQFVDDVMYKFIIALLYNFFAFAIQPIFGYLIDRGSKRTAAKSTYVLAVVATLSLLEYQFNSFGSMNNISILYVMIILASGIANAMFHTGAADVVMQHADGHMTDIGLFASAGIIGVWAGTYVMNVQTILVFAVMAVYFVNEMYKVHDKYYAAETTQYTDIIAKSNIKHAEILLLLLVLLQLIVSFTLDVVAYRVIAVVPAIFTAFPFFGRAAGGVLADRYGAKITSVVSTIVTLLCVGLLNFVFIQNEYLFLAVLAIGIVASAMITPIAIGALAERFPEHKVTAFGLTKTMTFMASLSIAIISLGSGIGNMQNISIIISVIDAVILICIIVLSIKVFKKRELKEVTINE